MTSRRTNVLFVIPSLGRGGAEMQVVDLVNALDPMLFAIHLVSFEPRLDLLSRVNRQQVSFIHALRRFKLDIAPALSIAKLIDELQIDVVHCSLQFALLMGWLGIRRSRRKPRLILALHTTLNRSKKDDLLDYFLYQWLMRSCDTIICVCKAQESHWQARFPFLRGKTKVIYNGIDTDQFDPHSYTGTGKALRHSLKIPDGALLLCNIAGFRREKGHSILLDAFARILATRKDVYLLLAGDGQLRSHIEALAQDMGLSSHVRFLGNVSDVRPILTVTDIGVISSTAETFSMAMLESMAMQVPLVATDVGGTSEAVCHGETGLIVPPGNPGRLAEMLTDLLSNGVQRRTMGNAARQLVVNAFQKSAMVTHTAALLCR